MWRNALKFQKPRSFSHSGKASAAQVRAKAIASSNDGGRWSVSEELCALIESRATMNGMRLEVAQATSCAVRRGMCAGRGAGAVGRSAGGRRLRSTLQPPLHLAAIHAAAAVWSAK